MAGFAQRQRIDLKAAIAELEAAGIKVPEQQMKLKDIAALNSITPMQIYLVIKPLEQRPKLKASFKPEDVEAQFSGTGIGRKTLAEMAAELKLDAATAEARLAMVGVKGKADDKMKAIGDAHDLDAIELVKILLIEGYRP